MHNRDLDKTMDSGRSGDAGGSRSRSRTSRGSSERMRNRGERGSDMGISSEDRGEDLQRKQREGDLGNERVRGGSDAGDMRGIGE